MKERGRERGWEREIVKGSEGGEGGWREEEKVKEGAVLPTHLRNKGR